MVQWVRAQAVLKEESGPVTSPAQQLTTGLSPIPGNPMLFWPPQTPDMHVVHIHTIHTYVQK